MRKAFTLIELMVVLSIASIIIGIGLASYYSYNEQIKLKNEAIKLVEVIDLAKKKTTSADLAVACDNFTGYEISITANSYSLNFCCDNVCATEIVEYQLGTNVIIESGTGNMDFPPLLRNINIGANTIKLKNTVINQCLDIDITSIGVISFDETMYSC